MPQHRITGLIIDCTEANCKHCQLSFLVFMQLYIRKYSLSIGAGAKNQAACQIRIFVERGHDPADPPPRTAESDVQRQLPDGGVMMYSVVT